MLKKLSPYIIAFYVLLIPVGLYTAKGLQFEFDFEQFFPLGDEDLAFFRDFVKDFESDDNFLLLAVDRNKGVLDSAFLADFHAFELQCRKLPYIKRSTSLATLDMPYKTPFGYNSRPILHIDRPDRYQSDITRIFKDDRLKNGLISEDTSSLVINLKVQDMLQLGQSDTLMQKLETLVSSYDFDDVHYLGRANFQSAMVKMQKREIIVSSVVSGILVLVILFLLYRRFIGVAIAIGSISISLLLFFGVLAALGRKMDLMSALYPVLMLIVGTSDVIHIMNKYIDELQKGLDRETAMKKTIRQIGVATLLTSLTTAVGFATLMTSNVMPINNFGFNAGIGVILAYIVVVTLTTSVLIHFDAHQLSKATRESSYWRNLLEKWYLITLKHPKRILVISGVLLVLFGIGISQVTTNYRIQQSLPRNSKITEDFTYFEEKFTGFRPMEIAIEVKDKSIPADGYRVLKEVDKIERYLATSPNVKSTFSLASIYARVHGIEQKTAGGSEAFPDSEKAFKKAQRLVKRMRKSDLGALVSEQGDKTRISTRVGDVGADIIKAEGTDIDAWVQANTDTSLIAVRRTGLGLLFDKNAEYVRKNLYEGLIIALLLVSMLMMILFKNIRMLFIALVPNLVPLLFAASLLGFLNIELEAGVSIIFAIIFGIAVDDTIHFLSKYRLVRLEGKSVEEALHTTFIETGKAITYTTIILFFGFLVMLFSQHPPSFTVGLLISVTLVGAWICDLFLLPVIMRRYLKDE